jgi:hypothetical protein
LIFAVLVEDALEDRAVSLCDFPVLAHAGEGVDEEDDVWADGVSDRGAVDEEKACGHPQAECEGGTEFVEHVVVDDESA